MSRIITVTDIRQAGHCATGIRDWFERQGFDFRDFLKNGIDEDRLRATGDGQILAVLKRIEARGGLGGEE